MLNHFHLNFVVSFSWSLFLLFYLQLFRCPLFYLLLDLFHNYRCLFLRVLLLYFPKYFKPFMAFLSIRVQEKSFKISLKRIDFLFLENMISKMTSFIICVEVYLEWSLIQLLCNIMFFFFENWRDVYRIIFLPMLI